jgi:hypothetical protein
MKIMRIIVLLALLAAPAPGRSPAVVVEINGAPIIERNGKTQSLQSGTALELGDILVTDTQSKIRIALADDSVLTLGPRTRVALDSFVLEATGRKGRLRVLAGTFKVAIAKLVSGGDTDYEIRTTTAVIGVRGTVVWGDVELDAVCSLDGDVQVRSLVGTDTAALKAGECVRQMGRGEPQPHKPTAAELEGYLKGVTLD